MSVSITTSRLASSIDYKRADAHNYHLNDHPKNSTDFTFAKHLRLLRLRSDNDDFIPKFHMLDFIRRRQYYKIITICKM